MLSSTDCTWYEVSQSWLLGWWWMPQHACVAFNWGSKLTQLGNGRWEVMMRRSDQCQGERVCCPSPPHTDFEMVHLLGCLVESQKVDHVLVLSIWHSRNTDSFFSWKVEVSFGLMKINLLRQWWISLFGQHISWATLIGSLHSFSFPQLLIPPQETEFWYAAIYS